MQKEFEDILSPEEKAAQRKQRAQQKSEQRFWYRNWVPGAGVTSGVLFFVRIFIGALFLIHAMQKLMNFGYYADNFPALFGIPATIVLVGAILVELLLPCLLITGIFTRVCALLLLLARVAALIYNPLYNSFQAKELVLLYIGFLALLVVMGGGRWGFGSMMGRRKVTRPVPQPSTQTAEQSPKQESSQPASEKQSSQSETGSGNSVSL